MYALAFIVRDYRIFVVLSRHGGGVEVTVVHAAIDRVRRVGAAYRQAHQDILIHRSGGGYPLQQHAALPVACGIAFARGERGDARRLVEVERRAVDRYRLQRSGVLEANGCGTRVNTNLIAVVGACHIGYIGDMGSPRAIVIAADTILRHNEFDGCAGLLQGAHQDELCASVPHTTPACSGGKDAALHAVHHLPEYRVAHCRPTLLYLFHPAGRTLVLERTISRFIDMLRTSTYFMKCAVYLYHAAVQFVDVILIAVNGAQGERLPVVVVYHILSNVYPDL